MKKVGVISYIPGFAATVIGGGIVLSVLSPDFKAQINKYIDTTVIDTKIETLKEFTSNTREDIKNTLNSGAEQVNVFFDNLGESASQMFKPGINNINVTEFEPETTYEVTPVEETSTEDKTEETPVVTEEPVQETVIYDEYTDTYLLDKGYEFRDIDAQAYNDENSDYVGYLDVPGTSMDYPVYQRVDDSTNDYYLHRDRNEKDYYEGELFVHTNTDLSLGDDSSTIQNTTIPIFGHAMADWRKDKKFNNLKYFRTQSFLDEHPYGVYYSEDGSVYALEIVASYVTEGVNDGNFMIYNLDNIANFNQYVDYVEENAIVRSDVNLEYGDKIVNLVACSYDSGYKEPKLIVVCKAVKQYTNEADVTNSNNNVKKLTK